MPKFAITRLLHQVKTELATSAPGIKSLSVDVNGGVIPLKGSKVRPPMTLIKSSAQLIRLFANLASAEADVSGFDIRKQTEVLGDKLLRIGFYRYYDEASVAEKV
jgi:hypothetical protein